MRTGLPEDYAPALARTADGYLWIGTSGGLVRFDGTRFTVFNHENEPAFRDDSVYCLYTSQDRTLFSEGGPWAEDARQSLVGGQ